MKYYVYWRSGYCSRDSHLAHGVEEFPTREEAEAWFRNFVATNGHEDHECSLIEGATLKTSMAGVEEEEE